jgi:hypothetical protein
MCKGWDLEFAGMVGVGSQESSGPGATACVCQIRGGDDEAKSGGQAAPAASMAGPITAAEAAMAAAAATQVQVQSQLTRR